MSNREYDDNNRGYLNPESQPNNRYNSSMRGDDRYYRGSSYDERYANPRRDIRDYNDYETPRMNNGDRGWRGDDIYGRYDSPRSFDPYRSAWNDWTRKEDNDAHNYYRNNAPGHSRPFYADYRGDRSTDQYDSDHSRSMRAGQSENYHDHYSDQNGNSRQDEYYRRNYENDLMRNDHRDRGYTREDNHRRRR